MKNEKNEFVYVGIELGCELLCLRYISVFRVIHAHQLDVYKRKTAEEKRETEIFKYVKAIFPVITDVNH